MAPQVTEFVDLHSKLNRDLQRKMTRSDSYMYLSHVIIQLMRWVCSHYKYPLQLAQYSMQFNSNDPIRFAMPCQADSEALQAA
jgi:hypothetical protein